MFHFSIGFHFHLFSLVLPEEFHAIFFLPPGPLLELPDEVLTHIADFAQAPHLSNVCGRLWELLRHRHMTIFCQPETALPALARDPRPSVLMPSSFIALGIPFVQSCHKLYETPYGVSRIF